MNAMITPNVIIAGAPKCGTTSVFNWLSDHPEVCASSIKEPSFFMDKGYPELNRINYNTSDIQQYYSFFEHCRGKDAKVILEATPHYMYQRTALSMLPTLNPRPKILFILRKPSRRVYSLFTYSKNNLSVVDADMSFGEYLAALKSDTKGALQGRVFLLNAIEHSKYVKYLPDWVEKFGRENVHIFLFEHLRENSAEFMKRVSDCIGIDGSFWERYAFKKMNTTYQVRSHMLQKLKRKAGRLFPERVKNSLKNVYARINIDKQSHGISKQDLEALRMLEQTEFAEYNDRLAERLSINLNAWK